MDDLRVLTYSYYWKDVYRFQQIMVKIPAKLLQIDRRIAETVSRFSDLKFWLGELNTLYVRRRLSFALDKESVFRYHKVCLCMIQ